MTRRIVWPYHILMVIYVAAVAWLCFSRFEAFPNIGRTIFGRPTDKVVHFCMFFPFPFLASLCFRSTGKTPWRAVWRTVGIFIAGCLYAAATEIIQDKLGYRCGDRADFLSDAIALAVSSLVTLAIISVRNKKLKA